MLIPSIVYGAIVGAVAGLVWALALDINFTSGLLVGAISGVVVGLVLLVFGKAAQAGSAITRGETAFVSGSLLAAFALAVVALGFVVWVIRVVFW